MTPDQAQLHERIQVRGIISGWLNLFITKLRRELRLKNISATGALERGIVGQMLRNGLDISEVLTKFAMYGRFVDMGVGKGVKAYERHTNRENRIGAERYGARVGYQPRRAKKWLNRRKMAEVYRLREILAEKIAGQLTAENMIGVLTEMNLHP
ncbi:hypothetical protein [Sphingobacterium multivorum]|uniref:hypothetical protein n=1 Tax=Sphingobacterium multivorum TaxID=28454 RepID=UPI0036BA8E14